jgi:hypothetical protein
MTQHELDEVVAAWLRVLPELLEKHPRGWWALIRPEPFEVLSVHRLRYDAMKEGYDVFLDREFLVQQIVPDHVGAEWLAQRDAAEAEYASWVCRPRSRLRLDPPLDEHRITEAGMRAVMADPARKLRFNAIDMRIDGNVARVEFRLGASVVGTISMQPVSPGDIVSLNGIEGAMGVTVSN